VPARSWCNKAAETTTPAILIQWDDLKDFPSRSLQYLTGFKGAFAIRMLLILPRNKDYVNRL
jgi:hypothetical protein